MAFVSLNPADLAQDKPFSTDLALQIKDNFDALNGSFSASASADIPNGSFEVDSDSNGTPDNWTLTTYAGGTVARETTAVAHGEASIKMVHPGGAGNGGGYATSDYIACNQLEKLALKFIHWAASAGMKNQVILYWYTAAKVACSTASTTIYDSTANPTTATAFVKEALPPATARFFKVRVVGGESSVNVAGSAYFDGLELTMTTDRVLYATSGATAGAVGTYVVGYNGSTSAVSTGGTLAGSSLYVNNPTSVSGDHGFNPASSGSSAFPTAGRTAQSGTWRAMAGVRAGAEAVDVDYIWFPTLWLRIS